MVELNSQQEDIMLEEGRLRDFENKQIVFQELGVGMKKCAVCCEEYLDVDIRKATIDECEEEVCVYCIENLELQRS